MRGSAIRKRRTGSLIGRIRAEHGLVQRVDLFHCFLQLNFLHDLLGKFLNLLGGAHNFLPELRLAQVINPTAGFVRKINDVLRPKHQDGQHQNQQQLKRADVKDFHKL